MPDNTIEWGQGAVNNTNNWGKAETNNTIDFGAIYDDSPSGDTNLTGTGDTPFTNTKSIDFDGVNDFIDIPNSTDFDLGSSFSISGWFNFDIVSNTRGLISFDSSSTRGWFLYTYINQIRLYTGSVFTLKSGYSTTGQWDNFIVTYDGTDLVFYLNGVQESTQTASINLQTNGNDGAIGNNQKATGRFFNGKIDEVAIWNTALSSSDVSAIYNSGVPNNISGYPDLIGWWRMGDGDTYPTIQDNKGSNDGTMTNMASDDIQTDVPS